MKNFLRKMYMILKRFLDLIISIFVLILLLPLFFIVAILIKIDSKGPVIFKQKRIGKNGKVFNIYKFRSMCVDAENRGSAQFSYKDDPRVTKVGKFIRATSIDELPQLINIIKGEMSIIGPRPVLENSPCQYNEYTEEQLKRFKIRPGVTGLAQVNGRKSLPWDKRLQYDVEYVEKISLLLDIKIFLKTIFNVILMKDNVNTFRTTENFNQENTNSSKE